MKHWVSQFKVALNQIQPTTKKAVFSTAWLITERLTKIFSELIVIFILARYLGPQQFGLLSYATAIISVGSTLAKLGLDDVAVRQLAEDKRQQDHILATCLFMKLVSGLLTYVVLVAISYSFQQERNVTLLIGILGLTLPIQAIDVLGFSFKAYLNPRPLVIGNSIALLIGSAIKISCVIHQAPLELIAWCMVFEFIISSVSLYIAYCISNHKAVLFKAVSLTQINQLIHESFPIIISGIAVTAYMRTDQIMIKEMLGSEALGLYSAASKISESWYFLPMIVTRSLLPIAVKLKQTDPAGYQKLFKLLFRFLGLGSFAIAILIFFCSDFLIDVLFGNDYALAQSVLAVHSLGGIFVCMGLVLSLWTIVEGKTDKMIFNTGLGAVINIILNLFFIQKFGILGAAISTIIARAFAGVFANYFIRELRPIFKLQIQAFGG